MARRIERAAVLGAGVMGAGIAAHLANAGIPCVLLDIVPPNLSDDEKSRPEARNRLALAGIEVAKKFKPAPLFYHERFASLVTPGNFEDHLELLSDCDLVIEAVVERLDIKRSLFERIQPHLKWGAIVSSNTSGLSIASMVEGFDASFKRNFLVTHFFNPVRFMKLLEIVKGEDTDPEVVDTWVTLGTDVLGKGVVMGKDTPNFVANRIGIYSMMKTIQMMLARDYTIEEIDAIFGPAMGRPKTAAFKTADLVGLDTFAHVAKNCYDALPDDDERDTFVLPEFMGKMIANGWLGLKTKVGFYKKEDGKPFALDHKTMTFQPATRPLFDSVKSTKGVTDVGERLRNLFNGEDRATTIAWEATAATLIYAAKRIGEIADDVVNIDNAMKWGFNWSMGPFETWDAIGVAASVEKMEAAGMKVPAIVKRVLTEGEGCFYKKEGVDRFYFDFGTGRYEPMARPETTILLPDLKEQGRVVKDTFGASLIDLGDGIACFEIHTKMNTIDDDVISMVSDCVDEVEQNFEGMVISGHDENFSLGANLGLVLMASKMGNWEVLDEMVRKMQQSHMRIKYAKKPVVGAPFGMALGGGCEINLHCARIQPYAELYMGLVEVGVGVIPAAGGTTQAVVRALAHIPTDFAVPRMPYLQRCFETLGLAKVSRSAEEARSLGFLRAADRVTLSRDRLIHDAKQVALGLARAGYKPPLSPDNLVLPGRNGSAVFKMGLHTFLLAGQASEYDCVVGGKLAEVICGGDIRPNTVVTEQHLLDLEREAFMSLLGMEKTQARIEYTLANGKPLRN